MIDDKKEKKIPSKSNSKDEVSEQRVPLKPVESLSLEEFEPVNEFGVRYKTIVECDGKCEKDENGKTLCIPCHKRLHKELNRLKKWKPENKLALM